MPRAPPLATRLYVANANNVNNLNEMKLIADSGSTKTAWCLVSDDGRQERISTQGINPYHQTEADIVSALRTELLPALCEGRLPQAAAQLDVFFYGAGCTPEASPRVASALLANSF